MAASIIERRRKIERQHIVVQKISKKANEVLDNCKKTHMALSEADESLRDMGVAMVKFSVLNERVADRMESLRNSYDASPDESEENDDSEKDGEEGEPESDAISEADSDNSSDVEIPTASQNHHSADQRQKSDGEKKRRRGESEDSGSDQESSFSRAKRSRRDAGDRVSAFDEEDLKLVKFFRKMSQLPTHRQIESFKYIHPMGKKMMVEWMDLVESFHDMTINGARR